MTGSCREPIPIRGTAALKVFGHDRAAMLAAALQALAGIWLARDLTARRR